MFELAFKKKLLTFRNVIWSYAKSYLKIIHTQQHLINQATEGKNFEKKNVIALKLLRLWYKQIQFNIEQTVNFYHRCSVASV